MKHKDKPPLLKVVKINHCKNIRKPVLFYWLLFLLFIFSFTIKGHAQYWAPEGSVWTYTQTFVFSSRIDTLVIRTIGDTVIQNKDCKILKRSFGTCDLRPEKEYMYADSGKVFFYEALRDDFQMLYDFNAEAGHSYKIYLKFSENSTSSDSITVTIDSVRSILINGMTLTKQFVSYSSSNWFWVISPQGVITESIGDTCSMFPWFYGGCDANWAGPLRCYYDNTLGLVDFETAPSCDYVTLGIEEFGATGYFKVYPNPANEWAAFEYKLPNKESTATMEISDGKGIIIESFVLNGNQGQKLWDTRGIATGTYIYIIRVAGYTKSDKLVISK